MESYARAGCSTCLRPQIDLFSELVQSMPIGRSYRRTFCLNFQIFFRGMFLYLHIFQTFFQILECEAFQIFCPLLNFQALEMFPVYPAFPDFLGKKRGKIRGKSCSIRTALRLLFNNSILLRAGAIDAQGYRLDYS